MKERVENNQTTAPTGMSPVPGATIEPRVSFNEAPLTAIKARLQEASIKLTERLSGFRNRLTGISNTLFPPAGLTAEGINMPIPSGAGRKGISSHQEDETPGMILFRRNRRTQRSPLFRRRSERSPKGLPDKIQSLKKQGFTDGQIIKALSKKYIPESVRKTLNFLGRTSDYLSRRGH